MSAQAGQLPTWWRARDARAQEAGKLAGRRLSDRTLRRIVAVMAAGCPELIAAMDARAVSIGAAAELARLTHDEQRRCLQDRRVRRIVLRSLRGLET
jgi:hypothetical protein